jgi:putative flippase GtrA
LNETPEAAAKPAPASSEAAIPLWKNPEVKRFSKFFVVGIIGALIDNRTFNGLIGLKAVTDLRVPLPFGMTLTGLGIAGATGFILAVSSNFLWNRFWVYPDSRSKSIVYQLFTFFVINTVGLLIRVPILELLSGPFGSMEHTIVPQLDASTITNLGENTAWALAVIVVMFWNFFVNRYWTYNDVK